MFLLLILAGRQYEIKKGKLLILKFSKNVQKFKGQVKSITLKVINRSQEDEGVTAKLPEEAEGELVYFLYPLKKGKL